MNDDQVLALTREITEIGTTQRQMMELLRDMRKDSQALRQELSSNYVTKAVHEAAVSAFKREIELLQNANTETKEALQTAVAEKREKPWKLWMIIATLAAAVPGTIALILGK